MALGQVCKNSEGPSKENSTTAQHCLADLATGSRGAGPADRLTKDTGGVFISRASKLREEGKRKSQHNSVPSCLVWSLFLCFV
jgi:hypothetical protein